MPIYEYTCDKCKVNFDIFTKSMSAGTDIPVCPECGSTETKKLMSSFAASGASVNESFAPACGGGT